MTFDKATRDYLADEVLGLQTAQTLSLDVLLRALNLS